MALTQREQFLVGDLKRTAKYMLESPVHSHYGEGRRDGFIAGVRYAAARIEAEAELEAAQDDVADRWLA